MGPRFLLVAILICAGGCSTKSHFNPDRIYSDVIPTLLDSVVILSEVPKERTDILINPVDDHLDSMAISGVLRDIREDFPEDAEMLTGLLPLLNERIDFDFSELNDRSYLNFISSKVEIENYNHQSLSKVGSSTVSPLYVAHDATQAVLYIDLQCGPSCGKGYLCFLVNDGQEWVIHRLVMIWK